MKKIYLLLIGIFLCFKSFSEPVDAKMATQIALNFMKQQTDKSFTVKEVITETSDSIICYYTIVFNEGGWVMVSADNSVIPVLGFSLDGKIDNAISKPDAFVEWTNGYKRQILFASKLKKVNIDVKTKWENLINYNSTKKLLPSRTISTSFLTYTPGTRLLNTPDRGEVMWNQENNNDNGCTPAYNDYCPDKSVYNVLCTFSTENDCYCQNKPVGCGAVAMGQIMWYWQWPSHSTLNSYDWALMPPALYDNTPQQQANAVAHLLRDCGSATFMTYCCKGSFTTMDNIANAFNYYFNYQTADKVKRESYPLGWKNLIKTEIDAGRPVLYRGGSFISSEGFGDIHIFVCDGYNESGLYHFNWGWGNDDLVYNGFFDIDNLNPNENNFNGDQMAIIGISPTCNPVPQSITTVPYNTVSSVVFISANNISLPSSGSTLVVEPGGNMTMTASESITLNPGFQAQSGCQFVANIQSLNDCNCGSDISVEGWTNYFCYDNSLCYLVSNANTFEIEISDLLGQIIYQNAGLAQEDPTPTCVWDGTNSSYGYYICTITFRNNCGRKLTNTYQVLSNGAPSYAILNNFLDSITTQKNQVALTDKLLKSESNISFNIFPNPTTGIFTLSCSNNKSVFSAEISDFLSRKILTANSINGIVQFDLSSYPKGIYIVKVTTSEGKVFVNKIVVQ